MTPDRSSRALPDSCSTWSRARATAAPMNDAATSAAGAPVPAAWSKWHPQRDPFDPPLTPSQGASAHVRQRMVTRRHAQALRAGRRSPPRDLHMAALPDDSTSARTGCRAFRSFLEITLGLHLSMRYHGARTCPAAHRSLAGVCSPVPGFGGSACLVSPHGASHDVPSIFGKRSERQARSPRDHVSAERRPAGNLEPSGLGRMPDRIEESTPSDQVARGHEAQ